MTLLALLLVGVVGAAGSGWALARGGTAARLGAVVGTAALVVIAALAMTLSSPDAATATATADAVAAVPGGLWNGALVPGAYLRIVIALWAAVSVAMVAMGWLLRGLPGLRGVLPASLAALVGASVSLAATSPALGIIAAAATGLASVPAVLATPRLAAVGVAAREVRIALATGAVVLAVCAVGPVLSRLVLANPDGPASQPGSGVAVAVAFGVLALSLVMAARVGTIPYHVRISALTDVVPSGALPLVTAWLPLPLGVAAVGVASGVLAPLALPVGSAQALIVGLALATTLAVALVAFLQDDLRHAVGYLTIADLGLVLLAFAALDPAAWGPARTWLLTVAVTKTALAAWSGVVEDRFETRSVPDLRGWLRSAPFLGGGLVLIGLATFGLPGWAVWGARSSLVGLAATGPWDALLLAASLLTLPAYLRWLVLGIGAPTSHVDRATPELGAVRRGALPTRRLAMPSPLRGRSTALQVEQEGGPKPEALPPGAGDPATSTGTPDAEERPAVAATTPRSGGRRRGVAAASSAAVPTASAEAPTSAAAGAAEAGTGEAADAAPTRRRPALSGGAATGLVVTFKRHRTGLLTSIVLALALLASAVAFGAFDVAGAAGEPAPGSGAVTLVGD